MLANTVNTPLYPGYATLNGVTFPTLSDQPLTNFPQSAPPLALPLTTASNGIGAYGHLVIAGDADGDGVADCLLFRIPGATYNGLTWYAGVRIVDNNSAVNVNTAWSRDQDYDFSNNALPNWGFSQSGVGLLELLNPTGAAPDVVTGIWPTPNYIRLPFNQYRFNSNMGTGNYPVASQNAYDETGVVPPTVPAAARADYNYLSQGDAFYNQMIRRIDNPGYDVDPNTNTLKRYQAIPFADAAALAYHFGLPNPNTGTALLESLLPTSLTDYQNNRTGVAGFPNVTFGPTNQAIPIIPYGGNPLTDIGNWWYENYDCYTSSTVNGQVPNYMPIRSLLTTHDPVSNYITPIYDASTTTNPSSRLTPFRERLTLCWPTAKWRRGR
jgi:hypothetical protein